MPVQHDLRRDGRKEELSISGSAKKAVAGRSVVITGTGKGKTTAALGIALRAAGHGMHVCIIQFIKGEMPSGETEAVKRLSPYVELHSMGGGFCGIEGDVSPRTDHAARAEEALRLAEEQIASGKFRIVILDEINIAVRLGLIALEPVLRLMDGRPSSLHLVLTGRNAHPEIIRRADTVTEMIEIKHPYREGGEPEKGIDY